MMNNDDGYSRNQRNHLPYNEKQWLPYRMLRKPMEIHATQWFPYGNRAKQQFKITWKSMVVYRIQNNPLEI